MECKLSWSCLAAPKKSQCQHFNADRKEPNSAIKTLWAQLWKVRMSQHRTRAWDLFIVRTHSCNGWPAPAGWWKWCGERCRILHYPVYESYNASLCRRTEDHCPWQTESSCLWKRRNSILSTGNFQSKLKQHTRDIAWTGVYFLLFSFPLRKQKKLWASHGHFITI